MKGKPVRPREAARLDIDQAVDYHLREAGERVTLRFIDALEATMRTVGQFPATGSPRLGYELNLPGVRSRRVKRFPCTVYYQEREDHIDVLRMLRIIPPRPRRL